MSTHVRPWRTTMYAHRTLCENTYKLTVWLCVWPCVCICVCVCVSLYVYMYVFVAVRAITVGLVALSWENKKTEAETLPKEQRANLKCNYCIIHYISQENCCFLCVPLPACSGDTCALFLLLVCFFFCSRESTAMHKLRLHECVTQHTTQDGSHHR